MDSRDSSSQPPHIHHPHLQHHHGVQQPPAHHGVKMIPHAQTQHYSSNSYGVPNSNNSFPFNPITAAVAAPKRLEHQFSDGSPSGSGAGWLGIEPTKKKRGRPRKYSPDDSIGLTLSSAPGSQASLADGHLESGGAPDTPVKRNRGRPPGSGKKQLNALGVNGSWLYPSCACGKFRRGSVRNISLRQTATSTSYVTYEGSFEIISLSGTFPPSENNDMQSQNGILSVSLADSKGRVFGGSVTGICEAASPIQIIVGSFATESKKRKTPTTSTTTLSPHLPNFSIPATGEESPGSGSSSGSAEENENSGTIDRGHGLFLTIQSMPMYHHSMGYSMKMHPSD